MIEIRNLTTSLIEESFLKRIARAVLEGESIKEEVELSIVLVGPGRIRKLNKKYLGRNRATDVLAFPEPKAFLKKFKVGSPRKIQELGEIAICLREVKKNAKRFNLSFEKELAKVLIHGILHLLGYDHQELKEKEKMEKKEEYYLSCFAEAPACRQAG